ncbi:Cytochrome c oxidase subunit 5c protein [Dioscorea alata]|uniref:Cytochrome c oxidase subunit 5c protein n=1 Tax=Dioscorea alata TaxID=55571 RepID=A0ACB7UF36_DIOAL|nr:Cytochrome c oxidase subunit 5c protein [Dioscorea alata]
MGPAKKIAGEARVVGPSMIKDILYGISLGMLAGGLRKMRHWNNQKRTDEFCDLLDKGLTNRCP